MFRKVTVHYLEMTDPAELRWKSASRDDLKILQAKIPCPELSRFLYSAVGGDWFWTARLVWNRQQWLAWLDRPEVETWIAYLSGTAAGYFELESQGNGEVELSYFGLIPQFIGAGIGGQLLSFAIERAWKIGSKRVWVHTCCLDHPAALANYQARGFRIYKEETYRASVPERPPGPWPGAN